jgi:hypothetical protein
MPKSGKPGGKSSKTKLYVGIDPGQQGAFAVIYEGGNVESWHVPHLFEKVRSGKTKAGNPSFKKKRVSYDYRTLHLFFYQLRKFRNEGADILIGVERQGWRPTDAKNVVFACGTNQTLWTTLIGANDLACQLVQPAVWKPLYLPKGADKEASRQLCLELYPNQELPLKKDEARAEATLIADYVRRKDQGLAFLRQPTRRKK